MKLKQGMICAALCLSLAACQAPLYTAVKENNVHAVKAQLAAGADPHETKPENWLWKLPTLPVAIAGDVAGVVLTIGTLGLYAWGYEELVGPESLTELTANYGSVSPVELARGWKSWDARQSEICYAMACSGRVHDRAFLKRCLSHSLQSGNLTVTDKLLASGVYPDREDLGFVLQNNMRDYAQRFMNMGVKPDDSHLRSALNKNNLDEADFLVQNGAYGDTNMLIAAIQNGEADKARFLVRKAGMNVNTPLHENSFQFIAQEAGQLPLYQELGGIMVAQPVAPPVDCPWCKDGYTSEYWVDCKNCLDGSVTVSYTYTTDNWYPGCDPNDPNTRGYTTHTGYKSVPCSSCGGRGEVIHREGCTKCGSRGLISRYAL